MYSRYHPEFVTVTCLNWIPILSSEGHKDIGINSLRFLVKDGRVKVSCFVLDTHFHLIWQVMGHSLAAEYQYSSAWFYETNEST
jgi:putative transposase